MYAVVAKLIVRSAVRILALMLSYSIVAFEGAHILDLFRTVAVIWPYLVVFGITGLAYDISTSSWRKSWRFTSLKDVLVMTRSATLIALALLLAVFALDRGAALPRSALFLTWTLDIGLFGGLLLLRRAAHEKTLADAFAPFTGRGAEPRQPLMLIGTLQFPISSCAS